MIDSTYFSPDILDFIRLLAKHNIRYLIVGGEAVIYYGRARLTGDVDFFYDLTEENAKSLFSVLLEFWNGKIPGISDHHELMEREAVIQFGLPPNRIDLMNCISGLTFEEAWNNRTIDAIQMGDARIPIFYIGQVELLRNKKAAGRFKDLDDLQYFTSKP